MHREKSWRNCQKIRGWEKEKFADRLSSKASRRQACKREATTLSKSEAFAKGNVSPIMFGGRGRWVLRPMVEFLR
jgi:hypothetical protein